ncbi:MAG TPA: hypothetical protein VFW19_02470 [Allosphingosinicella sp.]|nr:hypothetical protein [Allosphingosinicella sp.]
MPIFPQIQSPCPYKSRLASVMEGDLCRMCNRRVIDLSMISDGDRIAFMKGCEQEVCVSYRLPVRPAVAAAALAVAAAAIPTAAAAQCDQEVLIVVGGIKDPANVRFVSHADERALPELPVVYEEAKAPPAAAPQMAAAPRAPVSRRSAS